MQRTTDSTLFDARASGCDTTQYKYDGVSVQYTLVAGTLRTLDGRGSPVADDYRGFDPTVNCTLIGTYIPFLSGRVSAGRRYVFDCWAVQEGETTVDLRGEAYRSRYVAAKIQCQLLGSVVTLVTNHAILRAPALWATLPYTDGVKGLVFRDSRANAQSVVRVARWYKEAPRELF